ncbi:hypothetical protein [Mesorhizobium sp. LSHC414A00]|uniref:hypothetical protein n=1 Tax=Mesorhizobium sp. LSHC414A00 TaxID=1287287 RepID=UPI0003CE0F22|nr:hypothetical protein [Mesorhizobium sp. LSHC414A00]ESX66365.1 hypothetical protein X757_31800 [Mesorhizobium sp. LSHC414A00]
MMAAATFGLQAMASIVACSRGQFGGKLRHGDVILLGHADTQERTMRVECESAL